jgi:xanthine dehydrogenase large subunit
LWWDDKGRLRTHAPSTYKIPLASDRPYQVSPQLDAPATPERVLMAVERLKALVADAEMSGEDGADA